MLNSFMSMPHQTTSPINISILKIYFELMNQHTSEYRRIDHEFIKVLNVQHFLWYVEIFRRQNFLTIVYPKKNFHCHKGFVISRFLNQCSILSQSIFNLSAAYFRHVFQVLLPHEQVNIHLSTPPTLSFRQSVRTWMKFKQFPRWKIIFCLYGYANCRLWREDQPKSLQKLRISLLVFGGVY